jgi:hypothetical protein
VSRLSILEQTLTQSRTIFKAHLDKAQTDGQCLMIEEQTLFAEKLNAWEKQRDAYKTALLACQLRLTALGQTFITDSLSSARQQMEVHKQEQWGQNISACVVQHIQKYVDTVQQEARTAIDDTTITLPTFQLDMSDTNTQVSVAKNAMGKVGLILGGTIGAVWGPWGILAGASVGGWLSKSLFGGDIKQKTLDAVEQTTQNLLAALRTKAVQYLSEVDRRVMEAHDTRKVVWEPSNHLSHFQKHVVYYRQLVDWCSTFLNIVNTMKKEAIQ